MGVSLKVKAEITNKTNTAFQVTATVYAVSNYGSFNNNPQSGKLEIGEKTYNFQSTYKSNTTTKLYTKAVNVARTTKTFKIKVVATFHSGTSSGTVKNDDVVSITALPSYTIKYDGNGTGVTGIPGNQTKWYGKSLKLSSTTPKRTGYTFQGWNTWRGGGGVSYDAGEYYKNNAGATLYAQWTANRITITGYSKRDYSASSTITPIPGKINLSSLSATAVTNYKFMGWTTVKNSDTPQYAPNEIVTFSTNTVLYACYKSELQSFYNPPKITISESYRCNASGHPAYSGQYCKVVFNWTRGQKFQYTIAADGTISSNYTPANNASSLNMGNIIVNDNEITTSSNEIKIISITNGFYYSDGTHSGIAYKENNESDFSTAAISGEIEVILGPSTNADVGFDVSESYSIIVGWNDLTNENSTYNIYTKAGEYTQYNCDTDVDTTTSIEQTGYLMQISDDGQSIAMFGLAEQPGFSVYNNSFMVDEGGNLSVKGLINNQGNLSTAGTLTVGKGLTANGITTSTLKTTGNVTIGGKLTCGYMTGYAALINNTATNQTISSGDAKTISFTVSYAGYYPFAMGGFHLANYGTYSGVGSCSVYSAYITNRQNGQCTFNIQVRNEYSSTVHINVTGYVLFLNTIA